MKKINVKKQTRKSSKQNHLNSKEIFKDLEKNRATSNMKVDSWIKNRSKKTGKISSKQVKI